MVPLPLILIIDSLYGLTANVMDCDISTYRIIYQRTCKGTSSWFPDTKIQIAGSEPLIREADPPITKFNVELKMADKDGPNKKNMGLYLYIIICTIDNNRIEVE